MLVDYLKHLDKGLITISEMLCDVKKKLTVEVATLIGLRVIRAKCPMKVMAEVPGSTVSDSESGIS